VTRPQAAPRRRSRQVALQILFAIDVARSKGSPVPKDVFAAFVANFELPVGACEFAEELVDGITAEMGELDAVLEKHTTNWRLSRMAAVDRNILRIGTFELLRTKTPAQVILDEAIELARRFGADPSPAFVNGVLDSVAGTLRVGELARRSTAEPVS
jgi:N utilization substance protein B